MSQVVSKNQKAVNHDSSKIHFWKNPFLIAFHGAAASTYGYSICWQNVSDASAQLFARSNPAMRVYGKWRFLTYQCLVMQFVAYSLCFASHFTTKLRKPRDFFFTTFAFPIGMLVVGSFWSIWAIFGREQILPIAVEPYYPPWLNHVTHTVIAPINLVELLLVKHQYSEDRKSTTALFGYLTSYLSYFFFIRVQTGRYVYPFLNHMSSIPVGAYIMGTVVSTFYLYKAGKLIHNFIHRVRSPKDNQQYSGGKAIKGS